MTSQQQNHKSQSTAQNDTSRSAKAVDKERVWINTESTVISASRQKLVKANTPIERDARGKPVHKYDNYGLKDVIPPFAKR